MSRDDEDMLSGSDMERELADEEVQNSKNKGKGRDLDDAAPVPLAGAEVAHELDNLPWCARRVKQVEALPVLTWLLLVLPLVGSRNTARRRSTTLSAMPTSPRPVCFAILMHTHSG